MLNNDSTNFSHWDEVRSSWELIDRIESLWANNEVPLYQYKSGTMGPKASFDLLNQFEAHWNWQPDETYRKEGRLG